MPTHSASSQTSSHSCNKRHVRKPTESKQEKTMPYRFDAVMRSLMAGVSWRSVLRRCGVAGSLCILSAVALCNTFALDPLVQLSGISPFAGTAAGNKAINYPDTEVEPWIAVNPTNLKNIVAVWQQDRWSNGGARGLVAGVSFDGGDTWRQVVIPGLTLS